MRSFRPEADSLSDKKFSATRFGISLAKRIDRFPHEMHLQLSNASLWRTRSLLDFSCLVPMAFQRLISPKARRFHVSRTLGRQTNESLRSSTSASSDQPLAPTDMNLSIASLRSIVQPVRLSNGL